MGCWRMAGGFPNPGRPRQYRINVYGAHDRRANCHTKAATVLLSWLFAGRQ